MLHNQSLAEGCADALRASGQARAEAHAARKRAERIYDACLLKSNGTSDAVRKAQAKMAKEFVEADDLAINAEYRGIVAKAEADAAMVLWEEWRTNEASRREDRKFIAGYGYGTSYGQAGTGQPPR